MRSARFGRHNKPHSFIDDEAEEDEEEMEIMEEEDDEPEDQNDPDFNTQNTRAKRRSSRSQQRADSPNVAIQLGQRGAFYLVMFKIIKQGIDYGTKITELSSKEGIIGYRDRMGGILNRLEKFDGDLDLDRRAVDETFRVHSKEALDTLILNAKFREIRKSLQLDNPGKHQQEISELRNRIASCAAESQNEERAADESVAVEGDSEMEMLDQYMSDRDPITKKRIKEPVKNAICGHVYDLGSVQEYIKFQKLRRQLYQCPVELCKNRQLLKIEHLLPFPEFFQFVRHARSRTPSNPRGDVPGPSSTS